MMTHTTSRAKTPWWKSALCLLTALLIAMPLMTTATVSTAVADEAAFFANTECPDDLKCPVCKGNKPLSQVEYAQIPEYKDEPLQDDDGPVIVSLGDSFSSGEGVEDFYGQRPFYDLIDDLLENAYLDVAPDVNKVNNADWLAHRSKESWPGRLKFEGLDRETKYYKGTNWHFRAVSGALTYHLFHPQTKEYQRDYLVGKKYLAPQLDVFDELPANSVDYVTMTLGGNDVNFGDVVTEVTLGSTYLNFSKLEKMIHDIWEDFFAEGGVRDRLYASYKAVAKAAGPQATIIVVGYPRLFDGSREGWVVSDEESRMVNTAVSNFNLEIEKLVNYCAENDGMNICFVSVEEDFLGHGAYSSNPYLNEVYFGSKDEELKEITIASAYSMHPNKKGIKVYAECVNEKIKQLEEAQKDKLEQEALNASVKERDVVLVLDKSGSMDGEPMNETRQAAHLFVQRMTQGNANVGVVAYDDYASVYSVITDSQSYLDDAIDDIYAGGSTNIEDGLKTADTLLSVSKAKKKIIVLMSDGEPNEGKQGDELVAYADSLKAKGYYIYTLGFFTYADRYSSQDLMKKIASEGGDYEVIDADDLKYIFGNMANQASGDKYLYVRIACPVDVTVSYGGETMSSKGVESSVHTSFGTMTFEESKEDSSSSGYYNSSYYGGSYYDSLYNDTQSDTRVKILRLKEGVDYDIKITGNGTGKMDYTIGFVDENGEYSDMRQFPNINITPVTKIDTQAKRSDETYMYVDEDGDGSYDLTYRAKENGVAEVVDYTFLIWIGVALAVVAALAALVLFLRRISKIQQYMPKAES